MATGPLSEACGSLPSLNFALSRIVQPLLLMLPTAYRSPSVFCPGCGYIGWGRTLTARSFRDHVRVEASDNVGVWDEHEACNFSEGVLLALKLKGSFHAVSRNSY